MIHWLIQSASSHPDLTRAVPPAGLLCPDENTLFQGLKIEKRRFDWLLGRWTAKHLLRAMLEQEFDLNQICILKDANGAPLVQLADQPIISLSISHSGDYAVAAATLEPASCVGIDIEFVKARSDAFVHDYFTQEEIACVQRSAPELIETMMTAIWSAKEAALKALRLGLTVDTFAAVCLIDPPSEIPTTWTPFEIHINAQHLGSLSHIPALKGWWRTYNGYVLTLAAPDGSVRIKQEMLND